jgi:hypothetical protein
MMQPRSFGDAEDIFGTLGANGAQKLAAGTIVHDVDGQAFAPQRGKVNGILADSYVVEIPGVIDAHNDVAKLPGKLVAAVSRGVRSIGSCPPRSRHLSRIHEALPSGWHLRSRNREQNGRSRVLIVCRNQ